MDERDVTHADLSVRPRGDGARPLLLRLLHLVQEAHDALQLGLGEQGAAVGQRGVVAQLAVTLQVVGGQRVGVSVL